MAEEHRAPASGQQPQRQRRVTRQHSRKSKVAGAFLYVLFVIGLSAVLATVGWVWANDLLALNNTRSSVPPSSPSPMTPSPTPRRRTRTATPTPCPRRTWMKSWTS